MNRCNRMTTGLVHRDHSCENTSPSLLYHACSYIRLGVLLNLNTFYVFGYSQNVMRTNGLAFRKFDIEIHR